MYSNKIGREKERRTEKRDRGGIIKTEQVSFKIYIYSYVHTIAMKKETMKLKEQ